jgi:hypothetical protein
LTRRWCDETDHVAVNLHCRHIFHLVLPTLYTDFFKHFRARLGTAQLTGKSVPRVWRTTTMYWKAARRGLGKGEGVAGCGRAPLLPSKKNKLPGEAVREPGARWDWCASVLPRKELDTACIQRGDKHHFRGDRFDLPCSPLGGAVAVGTFRVASDGRRATQPCRK